MTLTHTFTRTHAPTIFADPYKQCLQCGDWIDGFIDIPGVGLLVPCEHETTYRDVCPSWGPVDGCTCAEAGFEHEMRTPGPDDHRKY